MLRNSVTTPFGPCQWFAPSPVAGRGYCICDGATRHKDLSIDETSGHMDPACDKTRCGLYKAGAPASKRAVRIES